MPSEVVQKENEISVDTKEVIETFDAKTKTEQNDSQENKELSNDINEEPKVVDDLSESDNKENEEPSDEDIEMHKKRAEELFIDGKRHLIIKDFQAAADVLSEACNLFGIAYGEMAEECAEAYFSYGCALLELGKDQISPVGLEEKDEEEENVSIQEENLIDAGKPNVTNEEKPVSSLSNDTDEVKDKSPKLEMCAELQDKPDVCKSVEEEMSVDKKEKTDEDEKKSDEVEEHSTTDKEGSDCEGDKPDEDIEEDDVNDLQLAWEMLDLAKVIYKNKDTEEAKLKLAEVLMKCGEVSIEDEKFETAIQDMTESLEIRRLLLPEDSRIIAETLFQLGIAQELGGSGELAIELLVEATAVLEQRIKTLEKSADYNDVKEEVAEVKSIIPEIQDRIVDIKERKKAAVSALLAAVGAACGANTNGESSTIKQASNINHLVRKRPKQEESDTKTPIKIPKLEDSSAIFQ